MKIIIPKSCWTSLVSFYLLGSHLAWEEGESRLVLFGFVKGLLSEHFDTAKKKNCANTSNLLKQSFHSALAWLFKIIFALPWIKNIRTWRTPLFKIRVLLWASKTINFYSAQSELVVNLCLLVIVFFRLWPKKNKLRGIRKLSFWL